MDKTAKPKKVSKKEQESFDRLAENKSHLKSDFFRVDNPNYTRAQKFQDAVTVGAAVLREGFKSLPPFTKEMTNRIGKSVRPIIKKLFNEISKKPKKFLTYLPLKHNKYRSIADYISGMTDRYAINLYNKIK